MKETPYIGGAKTSSKISIINEVRIIKDEIEICLKYALPYFISEDREEYIYIVKPKACDVCKGELDNNRFDKTFYCPKCKITVLQSWWYARPIAL